jgi:hypothetical protein
MCCTFKAAFTILNSSFKKNIIGKKIKKTPFSFQTFVGIFILFTLLLTLRTILSLYWTVLSDFLTFLPQKTFEKARKYQKSIEIVTIRVRFYPFRL